MALISVDEVRAAAKHSTQLSQGGIEKAARSILESASRFASTSTSFDIFLSHSYKDARLILDLKDFLENFELSVYVDWVDDKQLDRTAVSQATAATLRQRMGQCKALLYATTDNATGSVWMPWELGYFDGKKGLVAVLPLSPKKLNSNTWVGREYLGLYPYVVRAHSSNGTDMLWVHSDEKRYVSLQMWLIGHKPRLHA